MDFADSPEHAAFRVEVRRWLEMNLPPEICVDDAADQRVAPDREILEKRIKWQKTMHAAGWVGISWPREYGGRGATLMEQVIFGQEMIEARAPGPINVTTRSASRIGGKQTIASVDRTVRISTRPRAYPPTRPSVVPICGTGTWLA